MLDPDGNSELIVFLLLRLFERFRIGLIIYSKKQLKPCSQKIIIFSCGETFPQNGGAILSIRTSLATAEMDIVNEIPLHIVTVGIYSNEASVKGVIGLSENPNWSGKIWKAEPAVLEGRDLRRLPSGAVQGCHCGNGWSKNY